MPQNEQEIIERALKGLRFSVKSAEEGTVEAVFATFNVKDLDGDVTLPGAFEDGAEVLISAYNHATWGCAMPVGKGIIHADDTKAWLDGQFWLDTPDGMATFKVVKNAGGLQEYSYGYKVLETGEVTDEMYQNGVYRVLKKLKVYEVSPVMVGAGIGTGTVSIKFRKDEQDSTTQPKATEPPVVDPSRVEARREFARFSKTRAGRLVRPESHS